MLCYGVQVRTWVHWRLQQSHTATHAHAITGACCGVPAPAVLCVVLWCAGAELGALEITADNRQLLRSGYTRRRPEELAVLTR